MQNENEDTDNKNINISEFPILVCLTILGFNTITFNKNLKNPGRIEGVFKKTEKLDKALNDYWNDNLLISAKKFWSISRELKSQFRLLR